MGEMKNSFRATVRSPKGRRYIWDRVVCGAIIIKWITQECTRVDLIDLAQNRVRWRNFVNTLMNIQFLQYMVRNLLTTRETTDFSRRADLRIINYLRIFFSRCSSGGGIILKYSYNHLSSKQKFNSPSPCII
jgi:hypothetical protein